MPTTHVRYTLTETRTASCVVAVEHEPGALPAPGARFGAGFPRDALGALADAEDLLRFETVHLEAPDEGPGFAEAVEIEVLGGAPPEGDGAVAERLALRPDGRLEVVEGGPPGGAAAGHAAGEG